MKEINMNFPLKGLDGKDLDQNAGTLLAQLLAGSNAKTPVKFWEWALKFHGGKTIEITSDDIKLLRDLVNNAEVITALAKAQILAKL